MNLDSQRFPEETSKFYLTKDCGRAHIAVNKHYQGSVNCYNNFLTIFVTKLFDISMDVTIGDKTICANKKSYAKFLKIPANMVETNQVEKFNVLKSENFLSVTNLGTMRDNLSEWRKQRLSEKLIKAMMNDNIGLAKEAIGKGADINRGFWLENDKISGPKIESVLPIKNISTIERVWYTPYLYAKSNQKQEIVDLLVKFGADVARKGNRSQFQRELITVEHNIFASSLYYKDTYSNRRAIIYDTNKEQVREVPNKYQEYVVLKPTEGYNRGRGPQIDYYTYINSQKIKSLNSHQDIQDLILSPNKPRDFVALKHSSYSNLQMYVHNHYYLSNEDIQNENLLSNQYGTFINTWYNETLDN